MALPDNKSSKNPEISDFVYPDSEPNRNFLVYELGGVDLQNPSEGLNGYIWRLRYTDLNIVLERDHMKTYTIMENIKGLESLDLAFDQNMNAYIAYEKEGSSFLYWFDPDISQYKTSVFHNTRSPRLTLDDKRLQQLLYSDVILAFIRDNGDLVYFQQRDRFTIERILNRDVPPDTYLQRIGMTESNRLLFEIKKVYSLPLCEFPIPTT